jgi:hypothetical protein
VRPLAPWRGAIRGVDGVPLAIFLSSEEFGEIVENYVNFSMMIPFFHSVTVPNRISLSSGWKNKKKVCG